MSNAVTVVGRQHSMDDIIYGYTADLYKRSEEFAYIIHRRAFNLHFHMLPLSWPGISRRYLGACAGADGADGWQKWLDCSTNDIRSWPFLSRQISCLEPVSARDMQIALIYTGPGDCCLVRVGDCQPDWGGWVRRTCLSIDCHALRHMQVVLTPLEASSAQ